MKHVEFFILVVNMPLMCVCFCVGVICGATIKSFLAGYSVVERY